MNPLLNPPCAGWAEDLPAPHEKICTKGCLGNQTPNHQDFVYLEIPRKPLSARGVMSLMGCLIAITTMSLIYIIVDSLADGDMESLWMATVTFLVGIWITVFAFRVDICPPRDEPIRFNRIREKIYAYNFKYRWWNPFEKWQVVPVSYDWSQVRAERWSQTAALNGGLIFKWGVMLSIVEPGTNRVIDRFHLSTMGADEHLWAYICTYMQQGPGALPPPGPPKDHNDVLWCEFALRLAPSVAWPADMDQESTTAP